MTRPALLALAVSALALAACGKEAELQQPRPMFGHAYQPSPSQLRRDQAAARAVVEGARFSDPRPPQSVDEVRNQGLGGRIARPQSGPPDPTAPKRTDSSGDVSPSPAAGPQ